MSPLATASVVFACIFGVALVAMFVKRFLPEHHLNADSKDVVKLGMGTMATLAAIMLGLLIATAKGALVQVLSEARLPPLRPCRRELSTRETATRVKIGNEAEAPGGDVSRFGSRLTQGRDCMWKNVRLQFLLVAGVSALLGFAAASGKLNPFQKADAGQPEQPKAAAPTGAAPTAPGCCSDGLSKAGMVALATHNDAVAAKAAADGKKPNIVFIMGDDIGMWNIGAYHRGLMAGRTPNLDKLAKEGMLFTDYYAEASCTAGRANFITGELPIRTGMTTVGQAGAKIGLPAEACTIATALKALGYATGQFGKNHLGDRNEFLPTVHGFDEFFGYLYHLDAMEDPAHPNYPQDLLNVVGPRNMVHSWATDVDDPTEMPRWGKIGKQKIEDAGTLYPKRMETVDDEIRDLALKFIDKAKKDGKPFFVWLNPTRMHIVTHLSPKWEATAQLEEWLVDPGSRHGPAR